MGEGPVRTYGLAHVALNVADPERSFRFYQLLLGARTLGPLEGRDDDDLSAQDWIEFGIPGAHDVITLRRADGAVTGTTGELEHFGFRLIGSDDPDEVAAAVERAGGTVLGKGRFNNGGPYVFARDPDGYEIELWYETDPQWRTDPSAQSRYVKQPPDAILEWAASAVAPGATLSGVEQLRTEGGPWALCIEPTVSTTERRAQMRTVCRLARGICVRGCGTAICGAARRHRSAAARLPARRVR